MKPYSEMSLEELQEAHFDLMLEISHGQAAIKQLVDQQSEFTDSFIAVCELMEIKEAEEESKSVEKN